MEVNVFLYLAVIFLAAFIMKGVSGKLKMPEVTGYVLVGVMLGVSLLRLLSPQVLDDLSSVSTIALGIIAFVIGSELRFDIIRKLGKTILFIVVFECFIAFALVYAGIQLLFPGNPEMALLLGAVASATAPAATVAVIKQYGAKGPLTSTIMAVVGIDDAIALIIYVVASAFVSSSLLGGEVHITQVALITLISLGESFGLGLAAALVYSFILRKTKNTDWIRFLLSAMVFGLLGLSELLNCSELLAVMVFGAIIVNRSPLLGKKSGSIVEEASPFFLASFFILGGAHLDLRAVGNIAVIGLAYFGLRSVGKIGGASLGALLGGASKQVRNNIGLTLLPQVGVALALALSINKEFTRPQYGSAGAEMAGAIINILLFTTVITEVIGPLLTSVALRRAGETSRSGNSPRGG
jgi:Kef-type K+ transport system membrane component KefB